MGSLEPASAGEPIGIAWSDKDYATTYSGGCPSKP